MSRAWVSTVAMGAWHPQNFWTALSGNCWFYHFYFIKLCFFLKNWGFTSDWHSLFQIPNSSPNEFCSMRNFLLVYLAFSSRKDCFKFQKIGKIVKISKFIKVFGHFALFSEDQRAGELVYITPLDPHLTKPLKDRQPAGKCSAQRPGPTRSKL